MAVAAPSTEANVVSKFLYKDIFCVFGLPRHILADNGSAFDNAIVDGLVALVQVNHQYMAPYRLSTNGRTKQLNGSIMSAIRKDEGPFRNRNIPLRVFVWVITPLHLARSIATNGKKKLGFERLVELADRNLQVEDYNVSNNTLEYDPRPRIPRKTFTPGTHVVRVRHNKFSKMDSTYKPEVFTVMASFANGTCQLADQAGRLLKRRVNIGSLRQIHFRK
ncbi:hypothetical protein [Parasitella parasitica]|uniref:Integrase catalytic domain-containing protein n=1 Tax=Parasitella parasitica TaxID=35722 RepID=A0A0B7N414_9FUNG|nr:hypothetical protein [Parasitella parasitica]